MTSDADFMAMALAIGRRGLGRAWPNPSVGAVLVKDGVIVGRGWTQPGGRPHAEVEALRHAGDAARRATLYVTLEPCSHHGKSSPCADAVISAGVTRVVSATEDPNPSVAGEGHRRLTANGIAVDVGLGADEARRAHSGHIHRIRYGRPHVTLKLAVSADGKAGLAGRKPVAITGEDAWARVHMMRAMHDAVLTGIGTVRADDPLLTCRLPGMVDRSPVRVVLDGKLMLPLTSKLVATVREAPLWVVGAENASNEAEQALGSVGVQVIRAPSRDSKLDLAAVLRLLAGRGLTRVMVEAGPIVSAAFLNADLVDDAALFRAPKAIGADGIDALEGLPLDALTGSSRLTSRGTESIGQDTLQTFERA